MDYRIEKIRQKMGRKYIIENHYSGTCIATPICYGIFKEGDKEKKENLKGVIAFACPISENVRASVFGEEYKDMVFELHRMYTEDSTEKNIGSYSISKALKKFKQYKPEIRSVLSFADLAEGHEGTQYQAANAYYTGKTSKETFYKTPDGRLKHRRSGGDLTSPEEAKNKGWDVVKRPAKNRYIWFVPDKHGKYHKNNLKKMCKLDLSREYPNTDIQSL